MGRIVCGFAVPSPRLQRRRMVWASAPLLASTRCRRIDEWQRRRKADGGHP